MNTPDFVYWASAALMWPITAVAYMWMRHWRLQLQEATADMRGKLDAHQQDAPLADWCRHMSLTVITASGTVFSTTFAELQASEVPIFRNWNAPKQVTVWSDQADEELIVEARAATALQDEANG